MNDILVIGLGNILLSDEGVGVRLVETLQQRYALPDGVEVVDGGTAGMDLLDILAGRRHLLVCDAVTADASPGSVIRLADDDVPAFLQVKMSPHQLGLCDLLAKLSLIGEAPERVTLIGVVPEKLDLGLELSGTVECALETALHQLVKELTGIGVAVSARPQANVLEV